jgi:hypothetical protein
VPSNVKGVYDLKVNYKTGPFELKEKKAKLVVR